jgi:hypothetical protein
MKSIERKLLGKGKVIPIKPFQDNEGKYFVICKLENHIGIITNDYKCKKLKCYHYMKVYLD